VVVGGGVIGLAVAWRCVQRGLEVTLLDAGRPAAAHVAAGMLAPVAEADAFERDLLQLNLEGVRRHPGFCAELVEASGCDPAYRRSGTLMVARDGDDAEELHHQLDIRRAMGLPIERVTPSEARALEPALAPAIRAALLVPDDHSLDPRRLLAALRAAFAAAGGRGRAGRAVRLLRDAGRVTGVRCDDATELHADVTVVAAGAWTGELGELPVRPLKGQIMRLKDPAGPGLVKHVIRTPAGYLVPRNDGQYVLGGTMEEKGWDLSSTAGATFELIRDLSEVVPGILELELQELGAGLRPSTPDNLPVIGQGEPGLVWASGHHRHGVLLAPVTADLVADAVEGHPLPDWVACCRPERFAHAEVSP
jgi:glycine oxidase